MFYLKYKCESGAGTAYPSRVPNSPSVFSLVRVAQSLVFCVVFCRSLFVPFLLAIVLSVLLRCTASDYPSGMVKLYLIDCLNTLDVESVVFYIEQERMHQTRVPPKIGKNMNFWHKIVIYPKQFCASLRSAQFF